MEKSQHLQPLSAATKELPLPAAFGQAVAALHEAFNVANGKESATCPSVGLQVNPRQDYDQAVVVQLASSERGPADSFALFIDAYEGDTVQAATVKEFGAKQTAASVELLGIVLDNLPAKCFEQTPREQIETLAKAVLHEQARDKARGQGEFMPVAFPQNSAQRAELDARFEKACKEVASLINRDQPGGMEAQWVGAGKSKTLVMCNPADNRSFQVSGNLIPRLGVAALTDNEGRLSVQVPVVGLTGESLLTRLKQELPNELAYADPHRLAAGKAAEVPLRLTSETYVVRAVLNKLYKSLPGVDPRTGKPEPTTVKSAERALQVIDSFAQRYPSNKALATAREQFLEMKAGLAGARKGAPKRDAGLSF